MALKLDVFDDQQSLKRKREKSDTSSIQLQQQKKQVCVEDYLRVVEDLMYPTKVSSSYGYNADESTFPICRVTSLGYLMSSLRKPTVLEKWSPYEIALFESSIFLFGKQFHQIHGAVKTKTVKEIVEFYYEWKKSKHYQIWKKTHLPDERDTPTVLVEE